MKREKSGLERFLGLFTEMRSGEGGTALLLTLNVYLLLTTYYIIKPVREALILAGGGAELKSYTSAGQALLLLAAVPLYAALASKMPRRRLINSVTIFFAACLGGFYLWGLFPEFRLEVPIPVPSLKAVFGEPGALFRILNLVIPVGVAFFLWVGIFNLMVIAQFWAFANDIYTPEQGKRLFAIVAFGASFGAVSGSVIAGWLIAPLGVNQMLLVAGGILLVTLVLTNVIDARARRENTEAVIAADQPEAKEEPMGEGGAFQLVRENKYLLLIAFLMLFLNWVNTTGEYILGRVVSSTASDLVAADMTGGLSEGQYIGKFYADFFSVVNVVGVLTQLFLVSRILKYLGVRIALLFLPVIALGGYVLLALYPILSAVRWAKTAENATDYSLQNTVRNVLFLPTTREEKYKAKQAIDTFFVRIGDLLSAALVFVGTSLFAFQTEQFAMVNIALVAVWLFLAVRIGREYAQRTAEGETAS